MNEINFINIPVTKVENVEQKNKKSIAARELLKNGILVETNKGLVCMSLSDALNKGVGGHNLSEEDLQNVATELLFQETPSHVISSETTPMASQNEIFVSNKVQKESKKSNVKIKSNFKKNQKLPIITHSGNQTILNDLNYQETVISYSPLNCSSILKVVRQSQEIEPFSFTVSPKVTQMPSPKVLSLNKKRTILKNNKSVINVDKVVKNMQNRNVELTSIKNNFQLIDLNGINEELYLTSCEETSDNSEVTSILTESSDDIKPVKKRGGWPKGRKRKPEIRSEIRPPKAPATGYVIFLNEKRKEYKDLPFTEVTKLLGNEWSKLSLQEKKVYLDQAEIEKKRYREELKSYRQSDAYQMYLQKKRLKRLQGNGTEESDMDATDEIDEEENEELYCRSCDQWFHSLHNKKEHLYGRQHLQSIAGRFTKMTDQEWCSANMSSTSLDESSLDGSSCLNPNKESCCSKNESLMMDDAIVRFMVANKEREEERLILRKKLDESKSRNISLTVDLQNLNKCLENLKIVSENERKTQAVLEHRLFNLLNVPTLFYLPEASNEENA